MENLLNELLNIKTYMGLADDLNPDNIKIQLDYVCRMKDNPSSDDVIRVGDLKKILDKYMPKKPNTLYIPSHVVVGKVHDIRLDFIGSSDSLFNTLRSRILRAAGNKICFASRVIVVIDNFNNLAVIKNVDAETAEGSKIPEMDTCVYNTRIITNAEIINIPNTPNPAERRTLPR